MGTDTFMTTALVAKPGKERPVSSPTSSNEVSFSRASKEDTLEGSCENEVRKSRTEPFTAVKTAEFGIAFVVKKKDWGEGGDGTRKST